MINKLLNFSDITQVAGFSPAPDGKLNLPATQDTADSLAYAASTIVGHWEPGDDVLSVTLTGPGPVWGYLAIAHALHGRVAKLIYAAPNAPEIIIFSHGIQDDSL